MPLEESLGGRACVKVEDWVRGTGPVSERERKAMAREWETVLVFRVCDNKIPLRG